MCIDNLKFDYPTVYLGDELVSHKHNVQFYLLSCYKHFVISNNTFAWLGAWLSNYQNKIVVAPQIWFTYKNMDDKDIIPKDWIKI